MRIAIDMQGAQTESRFRGIGRYTLSLALAMARHRGPHEIVLVLNGMLTDSIEPIRAAFDNILPQTCIRVWYGPSEVHGSDKRDAWRREAASQIRETFIASLRPDVVHLTSLFEGYADDACTSIGCVDPKIPTAVTLYDLIPLLNSGTLLKPNARYAQYYMRKIEFLRRANTWLAISESTVTQGIQALQLPARAVINISAACESVFRPQAVQEDQKHRLLGRLCITRPFVMYSGGADVHKNLVRLIRAFARLPEKVRKNSQLVLVGKMSVTQIASLCQTARSANLAQHEVLLTGFISDEDLSKLYNLCAVFVLPSSHEGFGLPALEAMACGAAVIGSSTTSVPEVIGRQDALFDPYDEESIGSLLERVLCDNQFRAELAAHGLQQAQLFSWSKTAQRALHALELMHAATLGNAEEIDSKDLVANMVKNISAILPPTISEADLLGLALCASCIRETLPAKQLLVDVSELARHDWKTGIQRVTRSILMELLHSPPIGYVVEPIYANVNGPGYLYAKRFKNQCLKLKSFDVDGPISHFPGDIVLMLDLQHHVVLAQRNYLQSLRRDGVVIHFVVYDLLPIFMPDVFPAGTQSAHIAWLNIVTQFDGALCISATVADELATWQVEHGNPPLRPFHIRWFHLGADIESSSPSLGLPGNAAQVLNSLDLRPTFLMVGTVEPRKGHAQVIDAFELLWAKGIEVSLVIVGKCGWMVEKLAYRLRNHEARETHLLWLEGVSDEYLEKLYTASSCLIAASEGEGFGLPLIEAAQHRLPMIVRDIAVFREVAGTHAFYFRGRQADDLAEAVTDWLRLYAVRQHPQSTGMHWLNWKESTRQLLACITPAQP